jgi:hypothetical protein
MRIDEPQGAVHFEIPDLASAVRLTRRLGKLWHTSLQDGLNVNRVSALLRPNPGDLAVLLRSVEAWVEEESLCAIRYTVDGHEYVLTAGEADWSAMTALVAPDRVST